ncbi:MAG: M20 family metallo-hydrolase [Lewinellaceae bacterium]|nr:M20 family metallo-hydrolase [Lewinellaceae bacterium]
MELPAYYSAALELLRQLIRTPSFSREEQATAELLEAFLQEHGVTSHRLGNNVWARSANWRSGRPTLLLNSHHDTVKPVTGWQRDPFGAQEENGRLYGLGSNDAGASLVALLATFLYWHNRPDLPANLLVAASAEEEISGAQGIASLLPHLGTIDFALVGEPTQMQLAVAEKGLLVIDAEAIGVAGHAAREEGVNAIYVAMRDIEQVRTWQLEKVSSLLGPVKMTVTQIEAGKQHNVVPDSCRFVIDVRTNECYTNEEVFTLLQATLQSTLKARSFRLNSSGIPLDHPLVRSGLALGRSCYGSPTLSDQALMPFPSLKMGCGDSARSHTADEYIELAELAEGITLYSRLIAGISAFLPN